MTSEETVVKKDMSIEKRRMKLSFLIDVKGDISGTTKTKEN